METRAHLRPDRIERVREWAAEVTRRRKEALATLRDETARLECLHLEEAGEGDDLIAVLTAESFERSREAVERSCHAIDADHRQFKRDTGESGGRLELLVELNRVGEGRRGGVSRTFTLS